MKCPLCRQQTAWAANPWRPFCSERCQLTDLGTWAAEQYRIAGPSLTLDSSEDTSSSAQNEQSDRAGQDD
ncbi:MAG: DNA gyrase inhibitor YacG [Nitrospiraceae bacterium]|nr:DNA gyrase inhibitor YacG [Nitrospiraceae bacterium]